MNFELAGTFSKDESANQGPSENRSGLANEDVLKIMRHFDTRKDGQVSYNEFCDALPPDEQEG